MSQILSGIIAKSHLQATMATSAGRTNVLSNPKVGSLLSHTLTSATANIAYSFEATGTSAHADGDTFTLIWASGITDSHDSVGSVTFTMRDSPTATSAQTQQDPEGLEVDTMATLVAVHFETPATNTAEVIFEADSGGYGGGYATDFIGDFKFQGGDAVARSLLIVPRIAVASIASTCKFTIKGASGNSVKVTVIGKTV